MKRSSRSGGQRHSVRIVLPVHGAASDLERCLESVRRHTDVWQERLVLVLDGQQGADVERVVDDGAGTAEVVRLGERRGFAGAVNAGIERCRDDVVLLNSDAQVTRGWLEGLERAASSRSDVATVTPLSNDATLCSVPRPFVHNLLPAGHDVDRMAALVERVSAREYPVVPTGVGFCMYLRRDALDRIGHFDERAWAAGYGEENDLCLRAAREGWVNLVDDATFVYHRGGASFGSRGAVLRRRAARRLERRYPGYHDEVARFMRQDPMAPMRARILAALAEPAAGAPSPQVTVRHAWPARVLHIVHGWPPFATAGTEAYARWLARLQATGSEVTVFARSDDSARHQGEALEYQDGAVRVRLLVNHFTQRDPLSRNGLRDRRMEVDLGRLLDETRPQVVHVHHLAGHVVGLLDVVRRAGVPIVYQLQDWWAMCARVNLVQRDGSACTGPGISKCSACRSLTRRPPRFVWNRVLHVLRRRKWRRALRIPGAFVMGSRAVLDDHRSVGLLPERHPLVTVSPYPVFPVGDDGEGIGSQSRSTPRDRAPSEPTGAVRNRPDSRLRLGFVGSLLPHKGLHLLAEALTLLEERLVPEAVVGEKDAARAAMPIVLLVWGDPQADPDYVRRVEALAPKGALELRGRFADADRDRVLRSVDLMVVPSIGKESYGLVAHEALAVGTPVLAARHSALAETLVDRSGTSWFRPSAVDDLARALEDHLERWRSEDASSRAVLREALAREAARAEEARSRQHVADLVDTYDRVTRNGDARDRSGLGS